MESLEAGSLASDLSMSSNITNDSNCLKILADEFDTWRVAIISVCSASSVACVLAIIFIIASKVYKKFVYRLTLYLIVVALLEPVVSILDVVPVHRNGTVVAVRSGFEGFCSVVGFLSVVVTWMELLVICWIVLYLVMVLVFRHNANAVKVKHEACGLAVVSLLPLLVTWVPFVKNMYGLSEETCWIKLSENNTCDYDYIGLTFMFVFSYTPSFCGDVVTLVALCTILIVMCRRAMRQEQGVGQPSIYRQGVKEVLPLILYLLIYLLLWTAMVAIRICGAIPSVHKMNLQWLVHMYSVIICIRRLFIPFTCLLYLSIVCCRKEHNKKHPPNATTSFIVSIEFTDQEVEPLIIRQNTKIPSKKYNAIFEGSTHASE